MKENEIQIVKTETGTRMEVHAEFAITTNERIQKELIASLSREGDEVLDLTNVSHVDVVGIQLAYTWKKELEKQQRKATVLLPESENIKDLFVKTGITQIL